MGGPAAGSGPRTSRGIAAIAGTRDDAGAVDRRIALKTLVGFGDPGILIWLGPVGLAIMGIFLHQLTRRWCRSRELAQQNERSSLLPMRLRVVGAQMRLLMMESERRLVTGLAV